MNLQECYEILGGDLSDVISRLGSEALVRRFVLKFPGDGSFAALSEALAAEQAEEAFLAAHTLKGLCRNLSFTRLCNSSCRLTELLREERLPEARAAFPQVAADYQITVGAIQALAC